MLKYSNESFLTENPFMDILVHNLKVITYSCVIKDEEAADKNETLESLKAASTYIACVEKHAELGLFERIPRKFLEDVGVPYFEILRYEHNHEWEKIPEEYHKPLVELLTPWYIENIRGIGPATETEDSNYYEGQFEEKNNYYRMLIGLPPYGEFGVSIQEFEYLIPDYIEYDHSLMYFHELDPQINKSLEKEGVLDVVRAVYPEEKYLEFLTKDIDLYTARTKMDFQILWTTKEMNPYVTEEFENKYADNRKFMLSTVYSKAFELESTYYHSFMMSYTLLITLLDLVCEVQVHIIRKDILDRRCVSYIFSMYGIPYYRIIPFKYQERLCKRVHELVKYKSCDRGFLNIINLFGFENITMYKWFILKNRKINAWGEWIFSDKMAWVCSKNKYIKHDKVEENLLEETRGLSLVNETTNDLRLFDLEDEYYYYKTSEAVQRSNVLNTYDLDELEAYFNFGIQAADISRKQWAQISQSYLDTRKSLKDEELLQDTLNSEMTIAQTAYHDANDAYIAAQQDYTERYENLSKELSELAGEKVSLDAKIRTCDQNLKEAKILAKSEAIKNAVEKANAAAKLAAEANDEYNKAYQKQLTALKIETQRKNTLDNKLAVAEAAKTKAAQAAKDAKEAADKAKSALNTMTEFFTEETQDNEMLHAKKEAYDKAVSLANKASSVYTQAATKVNQLIINSIQATRTIESKRFELLVDAYVSRGKSKDQAERLAKEDLLNDSRDTLINKLKQGFNDEEATEIGAKILSAQTELIKIGDEATSELDYDFISKLGEKVASVNEANLALADANATLEAAMSEYESLKADAIESSTTLSLASTGYLTALENQSKAEMEEASSSSAMQQANNAVAAAKTAFQTASSNAKTAIQKATEAEKKRDQAERDYEQAQATLDEIQAQEVFRTEQVIEYEKEKSALERKRDSVSNSIKSKTRERETLKTTSQPKIEKLLKIKEDKESDKKEAELKYLKQETLVLDITHQKIALEQQIQEIDAETQKYRYIPFPIPFFLQKGNVLFIRLDDQVLTEGTDYEIIYYNTLKWKDTSILDGKATLTYDFYYDETSSASFIINKDNTVNIVQDFITQDADNYRKFSFEGTKTEEWLYSSSLKFPINTLQWIFDGNDWTLDASNSELTFNSSTNNVEKIADDEPHEQFSFVDIQAAQFKALAKTATVVITAADVSNGYITIPEPFKQYCKNGNGILIRTSDQVDFIDSDDYTITATDTYARVSFSKYTLRAGISIYFYFFYSDLSTVTKVELKRSTQTITQTSAYQYEYVLPDGFPVDHYIESGYKVYLKILDSWIPEKWYTIISTGTVVITNHSISPEHLNRPIELTFLYLDYDRTIYRNLQVGSTYVIAEKDFQKEFTFELPFADYISKGNVYILDTEGILLEKTTDENVPNRYYIKSQTSTSLTIVIPNRDIRPMKGNRVSITFYYQAEDSEYKLTTYNTHLDRWTKPDGTKFNASTFTDKTQKIFIRFPFYPYLETGHSFLLFIGERRIDPDRLQLVPGTLSSFTIKDISDEEFNKFLKNQKMQVIFFYNPWYTESGNQRMIVEYREQTVTDNFIEIDTPAEQYIENGWPFFVIYNGYTRGVDYASKKQVTKYLNDNKYDIIYHTFYTNPVSDLLENHVYGDKITFVYIYIKKPGYVEYKEVEEYDNTTSLHFSHADIKDLYQVQHIKDRANWKGYDVITASDGWWDGLHYIPDAHNTIKNNIYEKKFNYERTKYYRMTVITDLGEYAAQISYFYSMLYDNVLLENYVDILVPSLSPSHRFKLSHLFVYLTTLTFLFNGYEDFIIDRPSKWMWVLGFNFKTDLNTLKELLRVEHRHNSDYKIWDWIRYTTQVEDIVSFVNIYKTNYHVRSTILKGMVDANDYREWSIWKKIYDSLLIWKLNMSFFKLKNGTNATTYTEFLKSWDPVLYQSIMHLKSITDEETLQDEIIKITDDVIYVLEEYINGPECSELFERFVGHDPMQAAKYINILIDFFKSYKIMLLDRTEELNVNDPKDPDNYFRPIDNIDSILEQTINKDYLMPDEKISTTEHMELHEWIAVPDKTKQLIDFPYPTHNASYPQDVVEVKPALIQPYHSPLPEVTKITNTGLWMKEDITIEPYAKNSIVQYISPCKVRVDKLWFDYDLPVVNGEMEYVKQQAVAMITTHVNLPKQDFYKWFDSKVQVNKLSFTNDLTGMCILQGVLFQDGDSADDIFGPETGNMDQILDDYNYDLNIRFKEMAKDGKSISEFFTTVTHLRKIQEGLIFYDEEYRLLFNDFTSLCEGLSFLTNFDSLLHKYFNPSPADKIFDKMFYNCKSLVHVAGVDLIDYNNIETLPYDNIPKTENPIVYYEGSGTDTTVAYGIDKGEQYENTLTASEVEDYFKTKTKQQGKVSFKQTFANCYRMSYLGIFRIVTDRELDLTETFSNCKLLNYEENSERFLVETTAPANVNLTRTFYGTSSLEYVPTFLFTNDLESQASGPATINMDQTFMHSGISYHKYSTLPRRSVKPTREVTSEDMKLKSNYSIFHFVESNVSMKETFSHCDKLSENIWIVASCSEKYKVSIDMLSTFSNCKNLKDARGLYFKGHISANLSSTFASCEKLLKLHPITLDENATLSLTSTFTNCSMLTDIDNFLNEVKGTVKMIRTFTNCTNLTYVTLDISHVSTIEEIFVGCTGLQRVTFVNATPAQMVQLTHAKLDNNTLSYEIKFKTL